MPHLFKTTLFTLGVGIIISMVSCAERKTNDPIETYKFWTGELPPKTIELIHGKYWQSSHWSKEYVMYLELKAPLVWRKQFIKQNKLVETTKDCSFPSDAPDWLKPSKSFKTLVPSDQDQGSVYFEDSSKGRMLIYEIQL